MEILVICQILGILNNFQKKKNNYYLYLLLSWPIGYITYRLFYSPYSPYEKLSFYECQISENDNKIYFSIKSYLDHSLSISCKNY